MTNQNRRNTDPQLKIRMPALPVVLVLGGVFTWGTFKALGIKHFACLARRGAEKRESSGGGGGGKKRNYLGPWVSVMFLEQTRRCGRHQAHIVAPLLNRKVSARNAL